jgi:hypothetical protein
MRRGSAPFACLLALGLGLIATPSPAAVQNWVATDATVTMSLDPALLEDLGMKLAQSRTSSEPPTGRDSFMEGSLHAFRMAPDFRFGFRTSNGGFSALEDGVVSIPFRGGLSLQTWHPGTKSPLAPAFLYDFTVELDPSRPEIVRIVSGDPNVVVPLEVRSTAFRFNWSTGELSLRMGDMIITDEWARALGQPELAGQYFGAFDLRVRSRPQSGEAIAPEYPDAGPPVRGDFLDVTLGELYGLNSFGHEGTFPNGQAGLAAATTSCNSGDVRVPWNAPMQETHPTIGASVLRINADGVLEMLGQSWMKHGFLALSNDQCNLGCEGCGGDQLCIGCSDTYSAGLNASRFYLGPREEINPFTGTWEACGSFFDEPVVPDADCDRDYDGTETSSVVHRLIVWDEDLGHTDADYYYEGLYVVADDQDPFNSIGWRECTMSWSGSNWNISTLGPGLTPNYGPFILNWGDHLLKKELADDDGQIIIATQVTDLGGGQWHYEYAVYNWYSERGVRSFSVPIAGVNVSNVGFHDIDKTVGNDWAVTDDGLTISWATDDYATDPEANAMFFQDLFNFRFDADQPSTLGSASVGIFKPGIGTNLFVEIPVPSAGATAVLGGAGSSEDFALRSAEPNPFSGTTQLEFSIAQSRDVRLSVFDVSGRLVQVLSEGPAPAGVNTVTWNGRDASGSRVAPGVYFFRLESGQDLRTVKGTLLR